MRALKHNTKELKMSDAMIDAAIKEAKEAEVALEAEQKPIENEEVEQKQEEEQPEAKESEEKGAEEQPDDDDSEGDVVFPKKAVNAISRRDKKISKLQAQYQEAMQKLEQLQKAQQSPKEVAKPNADDFDSFDDYLEALVDYRAEMRGQKKVEPEVKQQPQVTEEQIKEQMYYAERAQSMDAKYADYQGKLADFESLASQNADILQSFNTELTKAVYEAEDPALALYVLAKENKLEEFAAMTPVRAARELALAEVRGQKYLNKTSAKPAPAPISDVKGKTNPNQRALYQKSANELMDWVRN